MFGDEEEGGCGVSGRALTTVAAWREKAEVRESWSSRRGWGVLCEWQGPDSCGRCSDTQCRGPGGLVVRRGDVV